MEYKDFGNTELRVSELGFGCSRLAGTLENLDERQTARMLLKAYDSGINFFDTADSYGQGASEKLLGKTFKQKRQSIVIASKAGYCLSMAGGLASRVKPLLRPLLRLVRPSRNSLLQARSTVIRQNFSPAHIQTAIESSLKRLRTDYLDLFQLHEPPADAWQREDLLGCLDHLVAQGKIRHYGVSCSTVEEAIACIQGAKASAVQVEINLLHQQAVARLLPLAIEKKVAVIARQPFASGRLTSADAPVGGAVQKYQALAGLGSRTAAELALQFVLQLRGVSVVIPGMSRMNRLDDNLKAFAAPGLTPVELEAIGTISGTCTTAQKSDSG